MVFSRGKVVLGCSAVASLLAANALAAVPAAATLASVDGAVMVNQGSGFAPVTDKTTLHPGDRVLSLKGARARLIYANGCVVSLKPGSLITVALKASCKATGASLVSDTDFTGDQAQGGAGAAAGAAPAAAGAAGVGVGGLSIGTIAAIGAGVAAIGVGAAAATGGFGGSSSS